MSRKSTSNFNAGEINRLLEIANKYKHTIENKKSDTENTKSKNEAWLKVASEFNAMNDVHRDVNVLKTKYKNLKYVTKSKLAQERQSLYGTGGGPAVKIEMTSIDDKMLQIINERESGGIPTNDDSDGIKDDLDPIIYENSIEHVPEETGSEKQSQTPLPGPSTLRTAKNTKLCVGSSNKKESNWTKLAQIKRKYTEEKLREEIDLIKKSKHQIELQNSLMLEKHKIEMEILTVRLQNEKNNKKTM